MFRACNRDFVVFLPEEREQNRQIECSHNLFQGVGVTPNVTMCPWRRILTVLDTRKNAGDLQ